jgi:hypothetical protein
METVFGASDPKRSAPSLEYNFRSSDLQANPNKTKQKSLDFLGFLWPNRDFSEGYGEKNKKVAACLTRLQGCVQNQCDNGAWEELGPPVERPATAPCCFTFLNRLSLGALLQRVSHWRKDYFQPRAAPSSTFPSHIPESINTQYIVHVSDFRNDPGPPPGS